MHNHPLCGHFFSWWCVFEITVKLKAQGKHGDGYASHRGRLCIKVTTQLKTSENSWEHRKTSKIIWYHPENNWGLLIDNLVQFEEDFNSRTKKLRSGPVRWGGDGYLRPDQFLDHLTVIKKTYSSTGSCECQASKGIISSFPIKSNMSQIALLS